MSVSLDGDFVLYYCHHCNQMGRISNIMQMNSASTINSIDSDSTNFLISRGISNIDLISSNITSGVKWFRDLKKESKAIGFIYKDANGKPIAIKWRAINEKAFTQEGPSEYLYLNDIVDKAESYIIITEGELDAIAYKSIGLNAVSVPNGASIKSDDSLWNFREYIKSIGRVYIASDNDDAGNKLANSLSSTIGRHKCWRVKYPDGVKDANDLLALYGIDALKDSLKNSIPWPVPGVRSASEYFDITRNLYNCGFPKAPSVGIQELDDIFNLSPSSLTVFTGTPGSGKSSFLNWYLAQMSIGHGFKHAIFSAEMPPEMIISSICAIKNKKSFDGPNKLTNKELDDSLDWINEHFIFIDNESDDIDSIIDAAKACVLRFRINTLVVDPFNFVGVKHSDDNDGGLSRTRSILTKLKSLCIDHALHVILVAHPRKQGFINDGHIPGGYDISGSADFYNVPDIGMTIHRDKDNINHIKTWKIRFKHQGNLGNCELKFTNDTGEFKSNAYVVPNSPIGRNWIEGDDPWDM